MNIRPVHELTLYRYRFLIGYGLLALLVAAVLLLNFNNLPPGLSEREQNSVLTSSALKLDVELTNPFPGILSFLQHTNAVDLPFYALQKISLHFFGLSPLGVRLPSIILAGLSAFMMFQLLRRWLRSNTAVVMGVLVATSSWFLLIGRSGSPEIMIVFWSVLLLLLATLVSQESNRSHLWKTIGLLCIGLAHYTPGMIYLMAAALLAGFTQPHLRYVLRTNQGSLLGGLFLAIIILIPLGFTIWREPSTIQTMLSIPANLPDPLGFAKNLLEGFDRLANPLRTSFGSILTPLISIPIVALVILGGYRLIKDWHSVRSHVLLSWLALLVPAIGLGMNAIMAPLFVPVILLSAIGMQSLIRYWYKLFPKNPYARVFGLVPLAILMISIMQFNYQRYFMALPYGPSSTQHYNQDPFILHDIATSKQYRTQRVLVIAPADKVPLYSIDKSLAKLYEVTTPATFAGTNNASSAIVAESELAHLTDAQRALLPAGKTELLVNDRRENALRFRVFSQ